VDSAPVAARAAATATPVEPTDEAAARTGAQAGEGVSGAETQASAEADTQAEADVNADADTDADAQDGQASDTAKDDAPSAYRTDAATVEAGNRTGRPSVPRAAESTAGHRPQAVAASPQAAQIEPAVVHETADEAVNAALNPSHGEVAGRESFTGNHPVTFEVPAAQPVPDASPVADPATPANPAAELTDPVMEAQARRVMADVVRGVRASFTNNVGRLHLRLDPPELGRVTMNMVQDGSEIRLEIEAQTDAARQTIESNIDQLRESLTRQGATAVTVDVRGGSQDQARSGARRQTPQGRFGMKDTTAASGPFDPAGYGLSRGRVLEGGRLNTFV
jgi:flagellar hook-length control protein FliK